MLAIQVFLASVLAVAAVGKLADLDGSRRALTAFGAPPRVASVGGAALPLIELVIASLLVLHPYARWGGVAALLLLLAFAGAITRAMSRGEAPDCNCFGALHSAPAGWRALARNVFLAVLAAVVAVRGPGPAIDDWISDRTAAELVAVAAGLASAALAAMALRTWWQNRALRRELEGARQRIAAIPPGLPVGALAPAFEVPAEDGSVLTLASLLGRGRFVALVFVRPGCGPSESLIALVQRWHRGLGDRLTIAVVGAGSVARYRRSSWRALADAVEHDPALLEENDRLYELFETYKLVATPSAVVLTPEGTVASATADGAPAIEALLRVALTRWSSRPAGPANDITRSAAA